MKARLRLLAVLGTALLLGACGRGLPHHLRNEIASEEDAVRQAERQLHDAEADVRKDVAQAPDLFAGTTVSNEWTTRLHTAERQLDDAKEEARELSRLERQNRADSERHAESLLTEERQSRDAAVHTATSVQQAAAKWAGFRRDLSAHLNTFTQEHDAIRAIDLAPVTQVVTRAEQDWPAKKPALETRLAALRAMPENAESQWSATATARTDAASGKASATEVATLIQADDVMAEVATDLPKKAEELKGLTGQLYDAWDKVLVDLDASHYGRDNIFREKVRTVRTHFVDVSAKKTDISNEERWTDVPESSYHAVENDLGMTIAHKDAGLFDSEAENRAQPPGFAYIAPPSQGSNQYGYWTQGPQGNFWTFLPQYLLLHELLRGHDYRPIVVDEYYGYRTAQRGGYTYYGRETPTSAPKYGSHGTFTQSHYASSRYVQSGGFQGSRYASGSAGSPSGSSWSRPSSRPSVSSGDSSIGKRFGSSSGHEFGSGRSSGMSSGKRFGSSGMSRSPGRSFGRRR